MNSHGGKRSSLGEGCLYSSFCTEFCVLTEVFVDYLVKDVQQALQNSGCCSDYLESVGREYKGIKQREYS